MMPLTAATPAYALAVCIGAFVIQEFSVVLTDNVVIAAESRSPRTSINANAAFFISNQ
jgi:hypothetical protein